MKQYLLFAGRGDANLKGVHGYVGDFASFADAFVALVDRQTPSEWWHILDTQTGEVVERQHLKVHNGMISFERSHWVAGQPTREAALPLPAPALVSVPLKLPDFDSIEADLRSAFGGLKNHSDKGKADGKANGAAADH